MSEFLQNAGAGLQAPGWLALLLLALVPLLVRGHAAFPYPSILRLPEDELSLWIERVWRWAGALAVAAMAVALSGPYWGEQQLEKVGRGAHVMIVLDRSASMNDSFADSAKHDSESKMAAARRVLQSFVRQSREDLLGMVTFSTSPILAAPLGGDREAVLAALRATEAGGMGFTAVARGLGMALDYFEGRPVTGARAILLVSDGGAHLDVKTQDLLREMFHRQGASLYWVYLRSANGVSIKNAPEDEDLDAYPEHQLHDYFNSLGVSYRIYEAESPRAVEEALADIAELKNQPVKYYEAAARHDLSWIFYLLSLLCAAALFALHLTEVKRWRAV
ncbi:vWA domain-containing protein [Methylobacillus flagellatus]|uniref:MxaC, protein involved in Ca2+ insertion into methanol dehydrogenase n=1 Tax=Methylobacillus flagellatus (strain ATCC 51484 / DSM 6875 / VKM B-1610 / KT) TaxID=265072 RepID=Q1GZN3_METFK|nr:vWA domain-containing protein [Methylobacillus flagellatus]ABE50304.1 MxaC, protein involved in Ca2+ insertion into methanol dehydrogenase [Methylobacillus flagellatus KT]